MREIKFRAWDSVNQMMMPVTKLMLGGLGWVHAYGDPAYGAVHPEDGALMQFTGLKDKNGTEIYEGDIVKHHPEPGSYGGWWDGIVTWQPEGSMGWCVEPLPENKHKGRYGMNYSYTFEVIGNIHEKPNEEFKREWEAERQEMGRME